MKRERREGGKVRGRDENMQIGRGKRARKTKWKCGDGGQTEEER